MNERIIYECEHCRKKRLLSKYQMREHESICWYNPSNEACNTCENNSYDGDTRFCEIGIVNQDGTTRSKPEVFCGAWKLKKGLEEDDEQPEDI